MVPEKQQDSEARSYWNRSILLAILILAAGACSDPPPRDRSFREPLVDVQEEQREALLREGGSSLRARTEDELVIAMTEDPGRLHPLLRTSLWTERLLLGTVFEPLWELRNSGSELHYEGRLAKGWRVSPSGLELLIELVSDARFAHGRGVSALDVQFTIERAKSRLLDSAVWRHRLASIEGVDIVERNRVRVRLSRPNSHLMRWLSLLPILPEDVYRPQASFERGQWVGSGPYALKERSNAAFILTRRDDHWGKAPFFRTIRFSRYRDAALALMDAKEGRVDIVTSIIDEHLPKQLDAPAVRARFSPVEFRRGELDLVILNHSRPPFEDRRVRQALAQLFDPSQLPQLDSGRSKLVSGLVFPGGPGNASLPEPFKPSSDEALRLLQASGYLSSEENDGEEEAEEERDEIGGDENATKKSLKVVVLSSESKSAGRSQLFKDLRRAGFLLDLRTGPSAVLKNRLEQGEFDMAFLRVTGPSGRDLRPLVGEGGEFNYGHFYDADVEVLLDEIARLDVGRKRRELVKELGVELQQEVAVLAFPIRTDRGLVSRELDGVEVVDRWLALRELSRR